jgi:poly(3-hydroxybutyrate) depolymerase
MFYPWLDWQRASLRPLASWLQGFGAVPGGGAAAALGQLVERTLVAGVLTPRPIEAAVRSLTRVSIAGEVVAQTPFVRLVRLFGASRKGRTHLLLAPHSGYAAAVLAQLALVLLESGDVLVTEWTDVREAPLAAGRFDLEAQARIAIAALTDESVDTLVAVSQGGIAALRAIGSLARERPDRLPARLALLGVPLDSRRSPTTLQQFLVRHPETFLAERMLVLVPPGYPGAGRLAWPGLLQLGALIGSSPAAYAGVQAGLFLELLGLVSAEYGRQHEELHSLVDVPGELFLDLVRFLALREEEAIRAALLGGPLAAIPQAFGLLTVEAEADALVGCGQTHAVAAFLEPLLSNHRRVTLPNGAHQDLLVGPLFETAVRPALLEFLG